MKLPFLKRLVPLFLTLVPFVVDAANFNVTSPGPDTGGGIAGDGSLSGEIRSINAAAGTNTLVINPTGGTITLSGDMPAITTANPTTVTTDGTTSATIAGASHNIFNVTGTGVVTISSSGTGNLTIDNGTFTSGKAAFVTGASGTIALASPNIVGGTVNPSLINAGTFDISQMTTGTTIKVLQTAAGTIQLGANTLTVNNGGGGGPTYSGPINGTNGALVIETIGGNQITTLSNATSNYSGGTTVIGPTQLFYETTGSIGTGALTFSGGSNASFILDNGSTLSNAINVNVSAFIDSNTGSCVVSGPLAGSGSLSVSSSGGSSLAFTNANTGYTGTFTLGGAPSTFPFNGAGSLPNSTQVNIGSFTTDTVTLTFAGSTGAAGIGNLSTPITTSPSTNALLVLAASNSLTVNQTGTTSFPGTISGGGPLIKQGSGTLTLNNSGSNTYTQGTTLLAGILSISNDAQLGSGGALTFAGTSAVGILSVTGSTTIARAINVSGNGAFNSSAATAISISGALAGSSTLNMGPNISGPITFTNANTGFTGTMVHQGPGSILFTGVGNLATSTAFTFGATNPNPATLDLTGAGVVTIGTLSGASTGSVITLHATNALNINQKATGTYSGTIGGGGPFIKQGASTLSLANTTSYTGATSISAGTLALVTSGTITTSASLTDNGNFDISGITATGATVQTLSGMGTIALGTKALTVSQGGPGTLSGVISDTGGGSLVKQGTSTLTLQGVNTYTGATTISAGTLALSTTGSIATSASLTNNSAAATGFDISAITPAGTTVQTLSGTGTIALGAKALTVSQGGPGTASGIISDTGTGSLVKQGSATLTLSGTNSYAGGTTLLAGSLAVSVDANLGNTGGAASTAVTFNGGVLTLTGGFSSPNRPTVMTGTGTVSVPAGSATMGGAFSGGGALAVGASGDAGTLALTNANSGLSGSVSVTSGATLSLTGSGSLPNTSQVAVNGTLSVGTTAQIGPLTGAGLVTLGTNALTINETASSSYSGSLTGAGASALTKSGANTLTFTGNGSAFTGTTTVGVGTLAVNAPGTLAGILNVNSGATLKGTGSVGAVTVASGGTLQAGSSIGTMTLASLTLSSGSNTVLEFNGTTSSLYQVTGAASLNGTLQLLPQSSVYTAGKTYTILTSSGLGGTTFSNFILLNGNLGIFTPSLSYSATSVFLTLLGPPAPTPGTPAGAVLNNLLQQAVSGDFAAVLTALNNVLLTQGKLAFFRALNELAPNIFGSFDPALVQTRSLINDILGERCTEICCSKKEDKACKAFSLWIEPLVMHTDQKNVLKSGLPQAIGYSAWTGGFVAGFDWRLPKRFLIGIGGGYEMTGFQWKHGLGYGDEHSGFLALYTSFMGKRFWVSASALGGADGYEATRRISFTGIGRHAHHHNKGWDVTARLSTGFEGRIAKNTNLTPFAQADYFQIHQNGFHEYGANSIDLFVHHRNAYWMRTEAGAKLSRKFNVRKSCLTPQLGVSWVSYFPLDDKPFTARFRAGTTPFQALGFQGMSSRVSPFINFCWEGRTLGASINYRAELSDSVDVQEGSARITWRF